MALVDPNIAMSFRQPEIKAPNALAQYAQLAQIQQNQMQQQMYQAQLAEYQRARAEEESVRNYLTGTADLTSPSGRMGLMALGKSGREVYKNLTEADKAALEQRKLAGELSGKAMGVYQNLTDMIGTKQDAIKFLTRMVNDPDLKDSPIAKIPLMEQVARIPEDPAGLDEWKKKFAVGAVKWAEMSKPHFFQQDTGAGGQIVSIPGQGGPATVVSGSQYTKTPSPSDVLGRQRLNFDVIKFNWEKANPGYELKEDDQGNFFGIKKGTTQAFPVTIAPQGATAPAAPTAPAITMNMLSGSTPPVNAMLRQPAAPAPAAVAPVAPPAAPAAPAPTAGAPAAPKQLVGKGSAMTDAQSNAAMFGAAMTQAQSVISKLEKAGTTKNAIVPGVLTGLASLVPLGVGENMGSVIMSTFNADPTGLIGPNQAQQQLAQAQLSFAIAYLRKTSGAAFGASEVSNTIKEFFPLIGEGDKVIAQKAAARDRAIKGMKISTTKEGRAYIDSYASPTEGTAATSPTPSANDPLGIR